MTRCLGRTVAVPYWNSAIDADMRGGVPRSPIYRIFGTEGCVFNYTCAIPNRHCLTRRFSRSTTLATSEQVAKLIAYDSFDTVYQNLEGHIHGSPHVFNGGDMETMYSSNDPIFYLHHANVDRLWAVWQGLYPRSANNYAGRDPRFGRASSSNVMTVSYARKYVPDMTVGSLLSIRDLRYAYSPGPHVVRGSSGGQPSTSRSLQSIDAQAQRPEVHKTEIHDLEPLPSHWTRMNRLNNTFQEIHRIKCNRFTEWLNHVRVGYVPRSVGRSTVFRTRTKEEFKSRITKLKQLVSQYRDYKRERKQEGTWPKNPAVVNAREKERMRREGYEPAQQEEYAPGHREVHETPTREGYEQSTGAEVKLDNGPEVRLDNGQGML